MDKTSWFGVILVIVCFITVTAFVSYDISHELTWSKAMEVQRLYYQATGEFPSQAWLDIYRDAHFSDEDDILKSLEYFKSKPALPEYEVK